LKVIMKQRLVPITLLLSVALGLDAQNYSIDWFKVAGGGGTSSNGPYTVSGSIGQPDASGPMTGGNYSLTGGFESLIAVVQTPGVPLLTITFNSQPSTLTISWPDTGSYTLQSNGDLTTINWAGYGGTVITSNAISRVTITPPPGNLFFRLSQP